MWKFREASSKSDRYSDLELQSIGQFGVKENKLYLGNQVEIKVEKKKAIYGYFVQFGHFTRGNKIFK